MFDRQKFTCWDECSQRPEHNHDCGVVVQVEKRQLVEPLPQHNPHCVQQLHVLVHEEEPVAK